MVKKDTELDGLGHLSIFGNYELQIKIKTGKASRNSPVANNTATQQARRFPSNVIYIFIQTERNVRIVGALSNTIRLYLYFCSKAIDIAENDSGVH